MAASHEKARRPRRSGGKCPMKFTLRYPLFRVKEQRVRCPPFSVSESHETLAEHPKGWTPNADCCALSSIGGRNKNGYLIIEAGIYISILFVLIGATTLAS